jgi:hypothetical protein
VPSRPDWFGPGCFESASRVVGEYHLSWSGESSERVPSRPDKFGPVWTESARRVVGHLSLRSGSSVRVPSQPEGLARLVLVGPPRPSASWVSITSVGAVSRRRASRPGPMGSALAGPSRPAASWVSITSVAAVGRQCACCACPGLARLIRVGPPRRERLAPQSGAAGRRRASRS